MPARLDGEDLGGANACRERFGLGVCEALEGRVYRGALCEGEG